MSADVAEVGVNALVSRVAQGDRDAFAQLYARTVDRCMGLAAGILGSMAWAEDCVADTYVAVWRGAARFDPGRADASTWIAMICRTRAIDQLRRERTRRGYRAARGDTHDDVCGDHDPTRDVGLLLATGRMQQALARLSDPQQRALELTFFEGMTHTEIALVTGWPIGTTKSHLRRAIATLRKELLPDELSTSAASQA